MVVSEAHPALWAGIRAACAEICVGASAFFGFAEFGDYGEVLSLKVNSMNQAVNPDRWESSQGEGREDCPDSLLLSC
jgi:hypothetical protein